MLADKQTSESIEFNINVPSCEIIWQAQIINFLCVVPNNTPL